MTKPFDPAELASKVVASLREFVRAAEERINKRTDERIASMPVLKGDTGPQGAQGAQGPQGEKGEPGPQGERGEKGDPGAAGEPFPEERAQELVARAVARVEESVARMVEAEVKGIEVVVPDPIPGKDGRDGIDGKDGLNGLPGRDGQDGQDGRDGRDGVDGAPGRDALALEILPALDAQRSYPRGTYAQHAGGLLRAVRATDPLDAKPLLEECGWAVVVRGIAGVDIVADADGRSFALAINYTDGSTTQKEFKLATMLYRGVYAESQDYDIGDTVTEDGQTWIAVQASKGARPGTCEAWKLAVRKGRNGKDADQVRNAPREPVRLK